MPPGGRLARAVRQMPALWGVARSRAAEGPDALVRIATARAPSSVRTRLASAAGLMARVTRRWPVLQARALLLAGRAADADKALLRCRPRRRSAAVAVAVAWHRLATAERLLGSLPDNSAVGVAAAALYWQRGDLAEALRAAAAGSGWRARVYTVTLLGEADLLAGRWVPPSLPPAVARTPGGANPPRIFHLLTNSLPWTASGYARRSHQLLSAQVAAGHDLLAATRAGYPTSVGRPWASAREHVEGVEYRRLLPRHFDADAGARLHRQTALLARVADEWQPDVLHTTTHYPNGLSMLAVGRALGLPVVYEVRGFLEDTWASTTQGARLSERFRSWQDRETQCMHEADLVVTLGHAMRDRIVARGVPASKVILAPNAVDASFLAPLPNGAEVRGRLGWTPDDFVVGTVTSVVGYEGLDVLVRAVAASPAVRLLVVGDGAELVALRSLADDLGLGRRVAFTGRVPHSEVRTHLAAMDVFVVPRLDVEVCRTVTPLKPVEAMAAALPVVASDLPALREIVTPSTGVLVPPEEPEALADALLTLAGDPTLRWRLGQAGRAMTAEQRTWSAVAGNLSRAYAALGRP